MELTQTPVQPAPVSENLASQGDALQNQTKKSLPKWPLIIVGVILLATLLTGTYLLGKNQNTKIACTLEAKICLDGSSVGRTGPKCEFAKCPVEKITDSSTPTCRPRPVCLDTTPKCMIPETSDMCPKTTTLKIPEYGVQIVLSDEIKDAYYINTTANKGYVYLKVHSLDSEPQCLKDDSSTAALSRVGKDEINPMDNKKYSERYNGTSIGNYFYYIDLAQYVCAESASGKTKLDLVRKAFTSAEVIQ